MNYDDTLWEFTYAPKPLPSDLQVFINKKKPELLAFYEFKITGKKTLKYKPNTYLKKECEKYKSKQIKSKIDTLFGKKFCIVEISQTKDSLKKIYLNEKTINLSGKETIILQSLNFNLKRLNRSTSSNEKPKTTDDQIIDKAIINLVEGMK